MATPRPCPQDPVQSMSRPAITRDLAAARMAFESGDASLSRAAHTPPAGAAYKEPGHDECVFDDAISRGLLCACCGLPEGMEGPRNSRSAAYGSVSAERRVHTLPAGKCSGCFDHRCRLRRACLLWRGVTCISYIEGVLCNKGALLAALSSHAY